MSREANAPEAWDSLWARPEEADWRADAMAAVYDRILALMPRGAPVVDLGGGVGVLASRLLAAGHDVEVWEHNASAVEACAARGVRARRFDLEAVTEFDIRSRPRVVVATEVLEHLTAASLEIILRATARQDGVATPVAFFSVPNDRLGPDEEEQHARKWTALEFKRFLLGFFDHVRVEVLGPPALLPPARFPSDRGQPSYLLGVVGLPRAATVSMCMPARDEEADVERTLASFMGFADEIVVGVDPRTKDSTRAIAEKYADVVFDLEELHGPPGEEVPEGGFHFAHARNQCMSRCTSDWIFMTEAHEPLWRGQDVLLHLDDPRLAGTDVLLVLRTGGRPPNRQQWLFPWLCRNGKGFRYKRAVHNTLDYGDAPAAAIPEIRTLHERVHERDVARQAQRAIQNRQKLSDDWLATGNEWSLHYLGAEWREHDPEKAIEYLREYLRVGTSPALRYHTRIILAKELARARRPEEARDVLHGAAADDWERVEHWVFLGDLAFDAGQFQEAATYFGYAATRRQPPLTTWWIDLAMHSWMPQQRLAMTYGALGDAARALEHARRALEDYREADAPEAFVLEAEENIKQIEEAINGRSREQQAAE